MEMTMENPTQGRQSEEKVMRIIFSTGNNRRERLPEGRSACQEVSGALRLYLGRLGNEFQ